MRYRLWIGIVMAVLGAHASSALAVGESVGGFPNWSERVVHEWINRARCDPQLEMQRCGPSCPEKACYAAMPPLGTDLPLARAARFHSAELRLQSYFAHDSACTVVPNIGALYPTTCDGSAQCACAGGVKACSPTCTPWYQRAALFGGASAGAEVISSSTDPDAAFYSLLFERSSGSTCQFTEQNGHRWIILKATGNVGVGMSNALVGDFADNGTPPPAIPSGSHYPRQAPAVDVWANWYAAAGPRRAMVDVDGRCIPLALARGTPANGAWTATVTGAGTGCHRYFFFFVDATGAAITYPTTGSFGIGDASCPDWDTSRPAMCSGGCDG